MQSIWKFPIRGLREEVIDVPYHCKPLSVQNQNGIICIWAVCDIDKTKLQKLHIYMHGTGWNVDKFKGEYLGTVQTENGMFVWHVFWDLNP